MTSADDIGTFPTTASRRHRHQATCLTAPLAAVPQSLNQTPTSSSLSLMVTTLHFAIGTLRPSRVKATGSAAKATLGGFGNGLAHRWRHTMDLKQWTSILGTPPTSSMASTMFVSVAAGPLFHVSP